jgi:hypothetical protein
MKAVWLKQWKDYDDGTKIVRGSRMILLNLDCVVMATVPAGSRSDTQPITRVWMSVREAEDCIDVAITLQEFGHLLDAIEL